MKKHEGTKGEEGTKGRRDGGTKGNPQSSIVNRQSPIPNPQSPTADRTGGSGARIDALLILLERLEQLHQQLHETLCRKLDLMRRASIDELRTCVNEEQALVTRISEQEGLRRQLMEQIGRRFGMSADIARKLSSRQLADRLPSNPNRDRKGAAHRLQALSGRLRVAVERVKKINDLVNRVTSEVLTHMAAVFSAVAEVHGLQPVGYTDRGRTVQSPCQELFEAIG